MQENDEHVSKKQKVFSIPEFRKNLTGNYKISYLQHFLKLCTEKKHDYILEYLQNGGNSMELLQITQTDPNVPPILILEIVSYVLLEVVSRHPKLHSSEHKACNFLLNQHVNILNKMLSLTSRSSERKIALKLLTTIVSFSPTLAKDVLVNVNFNATNLKLLTKQSEEKESVRRSFLNFLCAFLIDGRYPTISVFLGKPNLLGSVVNGLSFDPAESVCILLTALKSHVLENGSVSKTTKMKVFTTQVIREIVNLYNWKGPKGINSQKKVIGGHVDQVEKSRVNECVHDFLLTLCTTKHGVIFKDQEMGLGKTSCNNLILTVIQSLEKPWEHSYASELTIKICGSCPDVTKTLWSSIRDSLKPRNTEKWFKIIKFVEDLILEMEPGKIKNFLDMLSVQQIIQIIQNLIAPNFIIKILKSHDSNEDINVIFNIYKVFWLMLREIDGYLVTIEENSDRKKFFEVRNGLSEYILSNFPPINDLVDFNRLNFKGEGGNEDKIDFINVIVDILRLYEKLSPELLVDLKIDYVEGVLKFLEGINEEINQNVGINDEINLKNDEINPKNKELNEINDKNDEINEKNNKNDEINDKNDEIKLKNEINFENNLIIGKIYKVQIKIIDLFLKIDPNSFKITNLETNLSSEVLSLLLKAYFYLKDEESLKVVSNFFLKNTEIFENSNYEVNIWINSIFNSKKCDKNLCEFIFKVIQKSCLNYFEFNKKICEIINENAQKDDLKSNFEESDFLSDENKTFKMKTFDENLILVFGLFEIKDFKLTKSVKGYLNYLFVNLLHQQQKPEILLKLIKENEVNFLDENVKSYLLKFWGKSIENNALNVNKNNLKYLSKFSGKFLNEFEDLNEDFLQDFFTKVKISFLKYDILQMLIFYVNILLENDLLNENHLIKVKKFVCFLKNFDLNENLNKNFVLNQNYLKIILKNPNFLQKISIFNQKSNSITLFIEELIKNHLFNLNKNDLNEFLDLYRNKIFIELLTLIKNPNYKNFDQKNFVNLLKTFDLNQKYIFLILNEINQINLNDFLIDNQLSIKYYLTTYFLNELYLKNKNYDDFKFILNEKTVKFLFKLFDFLLKFNLNLDLSDLSLSLVNYLKLFPHLFKEHLIKEEKKEKINELFLNLILNQPENKFWLFLLEKNPNLINIFIKNIENIPFTKNIFILILDFCIKNNINDDLIKIIYQKFEPSLIKALEKPQKAGKYFENYYISIGEVAKRFFTFEKTKMFLKVKYDFYEPFLTHLLKIIYEIYLKNNPNDENKNLISCILTFNNLLLNHFKKGAFETLNKNLDKNTSKNLNKNNVFEKLDKNINNFNEFLCCLFKDTNVMINKSEIFAKTNLKTLIKYLLKFGLANKPNLLNLVYNIVENVEIPKEDLGEIMDMLTSHSEFMDLMLEGNVETKTELVKIMLEMFEKSEDLIQANFVPLILASYGATISEADRTILSILKLFEQHPQRTNFYDYKPFLWGKAAANHYSVKSTMQTSLWRQPRLSAVFDLLEIEIVLNTIKNLPLDLLKKPNCTKPIYDLYFLLPLFTNILSPENPVQTYRFSKSGALSLTILGLSSEDSDLRGASCYVLSLFYSHLEARKNGKDNLLWIRFIEAICKGIAVLPDLKINNFVAVFFSNMSLILTNPQHIMYGPLSQYLTAKSVLDFKLIPELYTLLHSSDVNHKEHKKFIFEVMYDGLRTTNDLETALHSVSFKLIMENFNSCFAEYEIKLLTIKIINRACELKNGVVLLSKTYGLLSWLFNVVIFLKFPQEEGLLMVILDVISNIIKSSEDYIQINEILFCIIDRLSLLNEKIILKLLNILCSYESNTFRLNENILGNIIETLDDKECLYYFKYSQLPDEVNDEVRDVKYYLKRLILKWNKC